MSARPILWISTEAGTHGELQERLKQALRSLDCHVMEASAGDVERLLDALAAGAVPVVFKEAAVD